MRSVKNMKLIKDTKKEPVAMFIRFQPKSYSGGRLCAMLMAEALSALGFEMHIFCNIAPEMESDFKDYSHHNQIQWHINRDMSFNFSKLRFKWIIVVPNLVTGWNEYGVYLQAARLSFRSSAKVIFINFESVSFFNQFSRFKRDPKKWQLWNRFVKYTDIIMSISRIGNSYAVNDYKSLFSKPEFDYCYPAINSLVAKKIMPSPPKKQVIIFCRWIDPHKNSYNVMKIFSDDLNGYNVVIVSGTGGIPKAFSDSLEKKARAFNMQLKLEEQVNEFEKFKMIAESRAMIYLSEFEGFGLPPIEAQYCG